MTHQGHVDFPDRSTILGAAKLTGKTGSGWNIGFISALTGREYAEIDSSGRRWFEEVEPFSTYGVLRAQRDIQKGQRGIGLIATGVVRDLRTEVLEGILSQKAFSLAVDGWTFLDKNRVWVIGGWAGATRVEGSLQDILRLQSSSMHYFQRPDATHVEVDPEATSLSGWASRLSLAKQQGRFILNLALGVISPGFDPNDLGFQYGSSDRINGHLLFAYQWTKPGKLFRNAVVFGRIDQHVLSSEIRINWTFTPRLTLQAYLQPFIAVGAYDRFKELAGPRVYAYNVYGEGSSVIRYEEGRYTVDPDGDGPASSFSFRNPDFNVKSLRGTIVLRWEYLPGSLLYFVWTQNRADYSHPGDLSLGRDLGDLLAAPGDNVFLVKVSFRWNM